MCIRDRRLSQPDVNCSRNGALICVGTNSGRSIAASTGVLRLSKVTAAAAATAPYVDLIMVGGGVGRVDAVLRVFPSTWTGPCKFVQYASNIPLVEVVAAWI